MAAVPPWRTGATGPITADELRDDVEHSRWVREKQLQIAAATYDETVKQTKLLRRVVVLLGDECEECEKLPDDQLCPECEAAEDEAAEDEDAAPEIEAGG